jgi:hypothetical protein
VLGWVKGKGEEKEGKVRREGEEETILRYP